MEVKFRAGELADLNENFSQSKTAVPVIAQRLLSIALRKERASLKGRVPHATGRLQRALTVSVRRAKGVVTARLGFILGRRVGAGTAVAANVLQRPGASPRKGSWLWIPLPGNRNDDGSPAQRNVDFVKQSKTGNMVAFSREGESIRPLFVLKKFVRFNQPPLPLEQRGRAVAEEVVRDLPISIAAIIDAKKRALAAFK